MIVKALFRVFNLSFLVRKFSYLKNMVLLLYVFFFFFFYNSLLDDKLKYVYRCQVQIYSLFTFDTDVSCALCLNSYT